MTLEIGDETIQVDETLLGEGVHGILPAKRKKKKRDESAAKLRKKNRRLDKKRQKQLDAANKKREQRLLMEAAAKSNLSTESLQLLRPSSELGIRKQSRRNRLKRELARSRANLPPESRDARLMVEREVEPGNVELENDQSQSDEVSTDGGGSARDRSSKDGTSSDKASADGSAGDLDDKAEDDVHNKYHELHDSSPFKVDSEHRDSTPVEREEGMGDGTGERNKNGTDVVESVPIIRTTRTRARRTGWMSVSSARALLNITQDHPKDEQAQAPPTTVAEVLAILEAGENGADGGEEQISSSFDGEESADDNSEASSSEIHETEETIQDANAMSSSAPESGNRSPRPTKLVVQPNRPEALAAKRLELPVCEKEDEIMAAVNEEDVIVVTGGTGTGKTTQVPQFLYEAGFGDPKSTDYKGVVAVTQPRRVAAMSCASRVSEELGVDLGDAVGYQVRHKAKTSEKTRIKFVTDGVLLREAQDDLLLRRYSAVIVDEAHERSINTDLLLTLLSRTVMLRRGREELPRLKVVVMSATLDGEGIFDGPAPLFKEHRHVEIEAKQFPVTMHFARKTVDDYVAEAFKKLCKIHRRLPQGGALVFMTGKDEVQLLCSQLEEELGDAVVILPLYAMLAEKQQKKVFRDFGERRKIVVATNVAETSITIPDITYVVDCGRVKQKISQGRGLLSTFRVGWTSKASSTQRAGRAGRTQPGHCYRLYSSAVFQNDFPDTTPPEVSRVPIDSLVIRLLSMGVTEVAEFPLPTRPPADALRYALEVLRTLGAVDKENAVTSLGETLGSIPIAPRYGRLLLVAAEGGCWRYAARMAAALSVGELFMNASPVELRKLPFWNEKSDILTQLHAVCAAEHEMRCDDDSFASFCREYHLHARNVRESISIAQQVERIYTEYADIPGDSLGDKLKPPQTADYDTLLGAILSAFPDNIARRVSRTESEEMGVKVSRGMLPFKTPLLDDKCILLSTASLKSEGELEYVCFSELIETTSEVTDESKVRMKGATIATRQTIASRCAGLCSFGAPLLSPEPFYDQRSDSVKCYVKGTYGRAAFPLGIVQHGLTDDLPGDPARQRYEVFCKALLQGKVFRGLKLVARGKQVPLSLLHAVCVSLKAEKVSSKHSMIEMWTGRNPAFLQQELTPILNSIGQMTWPPVKI
ncbi:hypothetical protein NDN08_007687 [Rhodosorus marinus]|uniref:RNA helicase n=1 Tax=Rhodosorus marinus TaxID=101924 RepID=A0AAV8V128_9RHOD|nr:hypothetical protein NDN08_007687 [Rhodosorus marinus]